MNGNNQAGCTPVTSVHGAHIGDMLGRSRFAWLPAFFWLVLAVSLSGMWTESAQAQTAEEVAPADMDDGLSSNMLYLPAFVSDAAATPDDVSNPPAQEMPDDVAPSGSLLWKATMETGNLSQWILGLHPSTVAESDSGRCLRPTKGVTKDRAHSGVYSMKMTIDSSVISGCRQFRRYEPILGRPLYYSAWYYFPKKTTVLGFWNIFQFKSYIEQDDGDAERGLFWKLNVLNNPKDGAMVLLLGWKGPVEGPRASDGMTNTIYPQTLKTLPVGKWVHIEVYLKQSENFDGQIVVWQDGVELYNMQNVRTKYPGGVQTWSINNYGNKLLPNPATLLIDDVVISSTRVGP